MVIPIKKVQFFLDNLFSMYVDTLYNIKLYSWKPIKEQKVKWEPYFIYTKKNVFVAKKPKLKKIDEHSNPYLIPIPNYLLKRKYKQNSINYQLVYKLKNPNYQLFFNTRPKYRSKKPNYYKKWLWFNNKYIEKYNTPPFKNKKFIIRYANITNQKYHLKLNFIFAKPRKIKDIKENDIKRLRLVKNKNKNQNYQLWKYNRLLYIKNYLYKYETNQLNKDYLLALINTKTNYWRPRVFPVRKRYRIRFPHLFYTRNNFHIEANIHNLLRMNKNYFLDIVKFLKRGDIELAEWKSQELLISLFMVHPEPYWSFLRHWVLDQGLDLSKKDQLRTNRVLSKARFLGTQEYPLINKIGLKEVELFKKDFPYWFNIQ